MRPFTIMVDSDCDLPGEYIKAHDIQILQMPFTYDGKEYTSGNWSEISDKDYYNGMRKGSVASTTLINPDTFVSVFTEYAERGEDLLMIVLSGKLSATFQNSQIALEEVREKFPSCNIYAIDSMSAAGGTGLLAMMTVKKRAEGLSAFETAAWLEDVKHRCYGNFMVDDLMYLHRGGRVSKLQAVAGSLIGVKPVLGLTPEGALTIKEKGRKHKGAMEILIKQLKQTVAPGAKLDTIIISHTDCQAEANLFASMVRDSVDVDEVLTLMMGPIIGAHVGPGCVALFFEADMDRPTYEEKFYAKK